MSASSSTTQPTRPKSPLLPPRLRSSIVFGDATSTSAESSRSRSGGASPLDAASPSRSATFSCPAASPLATCATCRASVRFGTSTSSRGPASSTAALAPSSSRRSAGARYPTVLPLPVSAAISVWRPDSTGAAASRWISVGVPNGTLTPHHACASALSEAAAAPQKHRLAGRCASRRASAI